MQDDGVGLGQQAAIGQPHHRHLSGRIQRQEFRRAGFLFQHTDLDPLMSDAQEVGSESNLQAIARDRVAEDGHGGVVERHDVTF